ncbi:MAG: hypothetical protein ACRELY_01370, partial [Polyangiaceae bacterium]
SNGDTGALEFTVGDAAATDATVIATGYAIEVDVTRYDSYWQCPDFSKSVAPGTRTTAVRIQSCGADPEPVALIDATCDEGCSVVPKNDDGSGTVKLVVTGLKDGGATLHVDVKSTTSSATWGDSFALQFSTATRMAVITQSADTGNTSFASMPGASFVWCPELRDANETKLLAPSDAITTSVTGDSGVIVFDSGSNSYVPPGCSSFAAGQPGTSSVVFTAQSVSASGSVRVANPNDIVGADLYALTATSSGDASGGADDEIGNPPRLDASPVTSIDLTLDDTQVDFASVLRLSDGSLALGGAGNYKSSSEEALWVVSDGTDTELASQYVSLMPMGNVIGDGTVDAAFGTVKVSIPFHITR